ncbi:MAG: carboxypeptidase regulatory-like domain-containing protein, partial [Planctomycetes bacterium]|nr:carboxypeptidase regulatory-like domain-containing protein [Planctomycetota bacterium]
MKEEPPLGHRIIGRSSYSAMWITAVFGVAMILATMAIVAPPLFVAGGEKTGQNADALCESAISAANASGEGAENTQPIRDDRERIAGPAGEEKLAVDPGHTLIEGFTVLHDGAPVACASIKATRIGSLDENLPPGEYVTFQTISDGEGWFAFKEIPPGTYAFAAVLDGFSGYEHVLVARRCDHPEGCRNKLELMLKPSGSICGRVVGPDRAPIKGAYVLPTEMCAAYGITGEEGSFELTDLQAGVYTLVVSAEGLARTTKENVPVGTRDLVIELRSGGRVSGTVTQEGKPAPDVTIRACCTDNDCMVPLFARTDSQGRYALNALEDGRTFFVDAYSDRYAAMGRRIMVVEGEHLTGIDFEVKACGALTGKVVRKADETPLQGIWVWVFQERYRYGEGLFSRTHACTGRDGGFSLPSLPPGDYCLTVQGTGSYVPCLWSGGRKIEIAPGEPKEDIVFPLEPGAVLDLKVSSES